MGWLSDLLKEYPALSVAKERLALAEERFKHIEEENSKLKARVAELEAHNTQLQAQLPKPATGELEEVEIEILKLLSSAGNEGGSAAAIARRLGINETKAEYYAEKLAENEYLYQSYVMNMPVTYSLDQKGREFLIKNDHI
jgi:predicted transcriptional regulator